ncbi:hypothetical protein IWW52_006158, partial [Coemansia sp. RSA 2704]
HLRDPSKTFAHPEYALVSPDKCFKEFQPGTHKTVETVLNISAAQQVKIRQQAKEFGVSFIEMVSAMLWKGSNDVRFQARPEIGPGPSLYTCTVNPRSRLGVSSNLCASPVINTSCELTVAQVAELDLRSVAHLVRDSINKCTGEYLFSSFSYLHAQRKKELENERAGRQDQKVMLVYVCAMPVKCTVSVSRTFPIYQTDFGFGAPEYVRPPFLPFDGCMRVWPTPQYTCGGSDAALEVYVSQPDYVDLSLSPLLPIGSTRLQSATGVQHVRLLTQRASLQSLQLASAPKPQYSYHDDNMLLASPSSTILPLGDLRDDANYLHYMQTGKTVTEQLSVMQNCLINGNTEQAQRILMGMYQLYPQAMREVVDVSIHNEILN